MLIPFPPRRLALALALLTVAANGYAQTAVKGAPTAGAAPASASSAGAAAATPAASTSGAAAGDGSTLGAISVVGDWLENPSDEKVLEHGGARTIIDRAAFQDTGATNVRDVLRRIPGVQVQESLSLIHI